MMVCDFSCGEVGNCMFGLRLDEFVRTASSRTFSAHAFGAPQRSATGFTPKDVAYGKRFDLRDAF